MYAVDYMKQILTNLYTEILTLPEDKFKELCKKVEHLLNEKDMTFAKFATIINKWIDEQK